MLVGDTCWKIDCSIDNGRLSNNTSIIPKLSKVRQQGSVELYVITDNLDHFTEEP